MIAKNWAPKCVKPDCNNLVDYHSSYTKGSGSRGYKWKQACSHHRGKGKSMFDSWKMNNACANADGHYGFPCTTTITDPSQVDINHIDGNKHNTNPLNIECLCRVCHARITVDQGHHQNRYSYEVTLNPAIFEVEV